MYALARILIIGIWVAALSFMGAPVWAAYFGGMVVGYLVMPPPRPER